jgi:Bacterial Ig-like domain (group 3)/FG-GAP-like repeat
LYDSGGSDPQAIQVADVNGDQIPDLLVINCSAPTASDYCGKGPGLIGVLLGNGDGTFQPVVTYRSGGSQAASLAVADLNGDGIPDIVVANQCKTSGCSAVGGVSILFGKKGGTFRAQKVISSDGASKVLIGDLNGDGKPDLVIPTGGNNSGAAQVEVLLGNGDGTFQPGTFYYAPGILSPVDAVLADLNRDGKLDIVISGGTAQTKNKVTVLLGNGDGTFRTGTAFSPGGTFMVHSAVADITGDGKPDIVSAACTAQCVNADGTLQLRVGQGNGLFPNFLTFDTGSLGATGVAIGDLNGDLKPDVAVISFWGNTVSIFLNDSDPYAFPTETSLNSNFSPSVYGQAVTLAAKVTPSGSIAPTGSVIFRWPGAAASTLTLDSNGVAMLTKNRLNAGAYAMTATYNGDTNNAGSTSFAWNQTVIPAATSATIVSSLNPSAVGQEVTFTANITSATAVPTGTVTFQTGTSLLGTVQLNSSGNAKLTISSLPVGNDKLTVTYSGNSNINGSTASITQTVQ